MKPLSPAAPRPRIGMICPVWLPRFGGAEQYLYRLAHTLTEQGFDLRIFAGTPAAQDMRDHGNIEVTRYAPQGGILDANWQAAPAGQTSKSLTEVFKHYSYIDAALLWAAENEIELAVIAHPFQQVKAHHARELYTGLKCRGVTVGCVHFDLGSQVADALNLVYLQSNGTWADAADAVTGNLLTLLRDHSPLEAHYMMASPLFFSPDFVISCSDWSGRFIDPDNRIPKLTLHPVLDAAYWRAAPSNAAFDYCDILMVNPQHRKGAGHMANLIADSAPEWTFRILRGGWGNSTQLFMPKVAQTAAAQEGRIEVHHYVEDIRRAYAGSGLVFFPSLLEGYGMTGVEPMYAGVPVVSSNYPAVLEAVGDGALTCCPFRATRAQWRGAVTEVLRNGSYWRDKSLARAAQLQTRQDSEIGELARFLTNVRAWQ